VGKTIRQVVARIKQLASQRPVSFTHKTLIELAELEAGIDEADACDVLAQLKLSDFSRRFRSRIVGEWLYVFKPVIFGVRTYIKVALRNTCLVISFHEDLSEGNSADGEKE
jgi:hypothetical protein